MKIFSLVCLFAAMSAFAQTTGRVPTGSGTSLAPSLTPGPVGGSSPMPSVGTQSPVGGFTPNPVGGFTPNAVGGFSPNAAGGFIQSPVGNINQSPVGGLTINPVTGLSQSPVTVAPTPQFGTTNQLFNLNPIAPSTNTTVTPSPF